MIQVSIYKDDILTNRGQFASQEEAQAWLSYHEGMKSFGQPSQTIQQQIEISPAVIAEDGSVLQEAVVETQEVHIPASYRVEVLDISSKLQQEAINAEALAFLAATDYIVVRAVERGEELSAEFKAERQAARDRIVK